MVFYNANHEQITIKVIAHLLHSKSFSAQAGQVFRHYKYILTVWVCTTVK